MPLHQHLIYILIGIPFPALVNGIGALAQAHGRYAVVLRNDDIAWPAFIHQGKIHCICAFSDHSYFRIIRSKHMVGIAKENYRNLSFLCDPLCDLYDRAGICIDQYSYHVISACTFYRSLSM